jgi:hypothetical protein
MSLIHPFVQENRLAHQKSLLLCKESFPAGHGHLLDIDKIQPQILDRKLVKRLWKTYKYDYIQTLKSLHEFLYLYFTLLGEKKITNISSFNEKWKMALRKPLKIP